MSFRDVQGFVGYLFEARRYEIGFILGAILFEVMVRSRALRVLFSREYLVDLVYCAFYRLGIFTLLMDSPVRRFVQDHLGGQLIHGLPLWGRMVIYLITLDLTNYWVHRIEHGTPWLWAFHQVHHSAEHLTIMTTYRNHPVDVWMRSVIGPVFFMLLCGIPPALWFPISLAWDINLNLSHLDVPWTYGPFRRLVVSPVFHAVHHSTDERHHQKNFGMTLSVWDYLFGTALDTADRPTQFGLPGWRVRNSFVAHLWAPVRALGRHARGLPDSELAPLTAVRPPLVSENVEATMSP